MVSVSGGKKYDGGGFGYLWRRKADASYAAGAAAGNIHSVSDSCNAVSDDYRGLCFELCGAVSADYGGIYLLLDKGAFPFHGLCTDSADLGSVLSFAESAAEVAVYFSRGAAFYILLDAVFRIFLVLCRPHGELFRDLRLYRGNHRLPYLAEPFADGTASGGGV